MAETAHDETIEFRDNEGVEDLSGGHKSYIERMEDFLSRSGLKKIDYFYLYQIDKDTKKNVYTDKYESDYPPDENDIGMKHGGGEFYIYLVVGKCDQFPRGTTRIYKLRIHERYTKLKEEREKREETNLRKPEKENFSSPQYPPFPQNQPPYYSPTPPAAVDLLSVAEKLMGLLTPILLPLLTKDKKDDGNRELIELIKESYKSMGMTMRETMTENFKMISDLQRETYKNAEKSFRGDNKKDEESESIVDKILPLISEWLPKLLDNGVQGQVAAELVKNMPQFNQIKNDNAQLQKMVQYLIETEGMEKVERLLNALGIQYQFYDAGTEQQEPPYYGDNIPAEVEEIEPGAGDNPSLGSDSISSNKKKETRKKVIKKGINKRK